MVYLYSENSWLPENGLIFFNKPVYQIKIYERVKNLDNFLLFLESFIKKNKLYAVGFFSYDLKEEIFGIKKLKKDNIKIPKIYINFYKRYETIQYLEKTGKNIIKNIEYQTTREDFIKKVEKAKKYIENGDIYQINLTHRIKIDGYFDKLYTFKNLLNIQKTPYLILIKDKDFSVISGSMELFLKKENNKIITEPIKGTIKRGKNKEEDIYLENLLKNSQKERAENLMITDLMRNDLGRIANNIKVKELFKITKYNSLFQMSSVVEGDLKKDITLKDIIYSTFPPGSVTGAPKFRAMQIIDELEDYKRHIYCGATFLIRPNLDFVMSVAIRQIIFQNKNAYIYVGSGIVADSNPEKEYEETLIKAKANLESLLL